MLNFEPFSLSALQKALPYIKENPSLISDLSAGYLYMWHEGADVRFCIRNGTFVILQNIGDQPAFSWPVGADPDGMLDEIISYAVLQRLPLRFFAADESVLEKIRGDGRLQPAMWSFDRRWSDYIYSFSEAASFAGKKYSGQRNHINKFRKLYGEPAVRLLTPADRPAVVAMLAEYASEHQDRRLLERMELEKAEKLFDVCDALGLYAAGLFVGETLAAFSIGEIMGPSLLIHVEKALTRYEGIYPAMYSGFVRLIAAHTERPPAFVNREDDSGDPGLRTSKMQYHPVAMAHKYLVHVASPAAEMDPEIFLPCGDIVLTEIRESDKQAYLRLNTDVENNKYWGYDYREDIGITEPPDENTFYDSVMRDMQRGDSINLSVRLDGGGDMIGEVILWNFASDGTAELGCRLLPEYQGHGYGRDAFRAAASFAQSVLHLKVWARCFRENTPSYRMIASSGFIKVREDRDFFYFQQVCAPGT